MTNSEARHHVVTRSLCYAPMIEWRRCEHIKEELKRDKRKEETAAALNGSGLSELCESDVQVVREGDTIYVGERARQRAGRTVIGTRMLYRG